MKFETNTLTSSQGSAGRYGWNMESIPTLGTGVHGVGYEDLIRYCIIVIRIIRPIIIVINTLFLFFLSEC